MKILQLSWVFSLIWILLILASIFIHPSFLFLCWCINIAWSAFAVFDDDYLEIAGVAWGTLDGMHMIFGFLCLPICFYWTIRLNANKNTIRKVFLLRDRARIIKIQNKKDYTPESNIITKINKEIYELEEIEKRLEYEIEIYKDKRIDNSQNIQQKLFESIENVNDCKEKLVSKRKELYGLGIVSNLNISILKKVENSISRYEDVFAEANNAMNAEKEIPTITH